MNRVASREAIAALIARSKNELIRVPGAAIPGILAPTIFFLGLNGVFGNLVQLRGFDTDNYLSFIIPISMLQGAGFTGAATGVNLARDIEQGWFDRLMASPTPRWALLAGMVLSACARALIPAALVLIVALILGAHFPGLLGLLLAALFVAGMAAVAAGWGTMLALRYRSQSAAPLMQAGMFILILFTVNPVTQIVEAIRQGFVGGITWQDTWQGLVALVALMALMLTAALRGMVRFNN